jgi:hypothetical protein
MTVEDIEEAILRLPPAELAKFRAWFAEFEAGRVNKKSEPQDTASRLGRIADEVRTVNVSPSSFHFLPLSVRPKTF